MENRSNFMPAIFAMMGVFLLWLVMVQVFFPQPPPEEQPPTAESMTPAPGEGAEESTQAPVEVAATGAETPVEQRATDDADQAPAEGAKRKLRAVGVDEQEVVVLGDASTYRAGPYRMQIITDNRGGAIRELQLNDYHAHALRGSDKDSGDRLTLMQAVGEPGGGREFLSMATERITLLEEGRQRKLKLAEELWRVSGRTDGRGSQAVTFGITVVDEDQPLLEIDKRYELPAQDAESGRFDLLLSVRVRNVADRPVEFFVEQGGPIGVPLEASRMDARMVLAANLVDGVPGVKTFKHDKLAKGVVELGEGGTQVGNGLAWAALADKFFVSIMAPAYDGGDTFGHRIAKAEALTQMPYVDRDAPSDMTFRFRTTRQTLQPGADTVFEFACYMGPKARTSFENNEEYLRRGYMAALTEGYSGCTFEGLAVLMVKLLMFFHGLLFGNYGLAIIVLVLVVRVILHPVTKKGQVNMVRMQSKMAVMQPRLEEIKKKYANDKGKLNEETMKVYRESGLSPAGQMLTCLPMMLQMPIWIALFTALSNTVEMRHEPFILWIRDLTGPDALITFARPFSVPLLSAMIGQVHSFNVLPILLSVAMYMQQKFMPKAAQAHKRKSKTPDQMAQQQKIMSFMMVFMGVMFYNAPSGLNLYIMASTFFGVLEQWRIRQHIKKEEAAGGIAPVPARPKPSGPRRPSLLERLAKKAEDARQLRSKRPKRPRM